MENWMIIVIVLAVLLLINYYIYDMYNSAKDFIHSLFYYVGLCKCDPNIEYEGFGGGNGALESLHSNHGIQDIHLTVNNDNSSWDDWSWGGLWGGYGWGYNPYRYWRGVPWYLPTRNLSRVGYYPYTYDYNLDRYGRYYPYW